MKTKLETYQLEYEIILHTISILRRRRLINEIEQNDTINQLMDMETRRDKLEDILENGTHHYFDQYQFSHYELEI